LAGKFGAVLPVADARIILLVARAPSWRRAKTRRFRGAPASASPAAGQRGHAPAAFLARLFPDSRSAPRLRCESPALYRYGRGRARSEHAVNVARRGGGRCCDIRPLCEANIHGCTARPFRRQQGARAPRCTVALTGAAQVLSQFLPRNEVRPAACPPFLPNPPCCALPTPKQLQAPWWSRSQPLLALLALTFPPHIRRSLWPRRRGFGARLALRAPFVHTLWTAHASQGGHHLARTGTSARFR